MNLENFPFIAHSIAIKDDWTWCVGFYPKSNEKEQRGKQHHPDK
jgi:hypothetical protein